jgi:hypothetical protein
MTKKAELISNNFGAIYLTIISLLQGFALSQWVPNVIDYLNMAEAPWTNILIVPQLLMLMIIFVVWHHYAIGIFYVRWFPNIIDSFIPFAVSIIQFFLLSYLSIQTSLADIDVETWTKGFAIFLLMGSFAYFSAAWRPEKDLFLNIMSAENAAAHCKRSGKYYEWAGVSILCQGIFAFIIVLVREDQLLLISLFLFISHLVISEYFLLRKIRPQFIKAMDEFENQEHQQSA